MYVVILVADQDHDGGFEFKHTQTLWRQYNLLPPKYFLYNISSHLCLYKNLYTNTCTHWLVFCFPFSQPNCSRRYKNMRVHCSSRICYNKFKLKNFLWTEKIYRDSKACTMSSENQRDLYFIHTTRSITIHN